MRTSIQFLCLVVITGLACAVPQPQQSAQPAAAPALGDVVRQDKAVAKPKAKRVFTDDDVVHGSSVPDDPKTAAAAAGDAAKPASTATEDAKAAGTDSAANPDAKKDASTPAAKSKADRLAQLKKDQEAYQSIIQQLEGKISNETDQTRINTFNETIGRTKQRMIDGQKEIDALENSSSTAAPPTPPQ
jgi:hypothetical protein